MGPHALDDFSKAAQGDFKVARRIDATQGSKAERTKPARVAAISKAMAEMPRLVAAHRAERGRAAHEHKLEKLFKKKKWI